MIRYAEKERALRSDSEEHPGVLCISSREVHDWGAFVLDRRFDPVAVSQTGMQAIRPDQISAEVLEGTSEAFSAEQVVAECEGPVEINFVGGMIRDTMQAALELYFRSLDFQQLEGLERLYREFAAAVWKRFPEGPEGPDTQSA